MASNLTDWQYWMVQNLALLSKKYGRDGVVLNGKTWRSILIFYFALPPSWNRRTTRLLIVLPEKSKLFYAPPDRFYIDVGLRLANGSIPAHYFEGQGFNDLSSQGLARFSFHLTDGWQPALESQNGTNLLHVIDGLYRGMNSAAREVMY